MKCPHTSRRRDRMRWSRDRHICQEQTQWMAGEKLVSDSCSSRRRGREHRLIPGGRSGRFSYNKVSIKRGQKKILPQVPQRLRGNQCKGGLTPTNGFNRALKKILQLAHSDGKEKNRQMWTMCRFQADQRKIGRVRKYFFYGVGNASFCLLHTFRPM